MSRPLRIEYPDAWYLVMNRGRRGESIFSDEKDHKQLTQPLFSKVVGLYIKGLGAAIASSCNHCYVPQVFYLSENLTYLNHIWGNYPPLKSAIFESRNEAKESLIAIDVKARLFSVFFPRL